MTFSLAATADTVIERVRKFPSCSSGLLLLLVVVLVATGVLARLSLFLDVDGRLFWQFMTEDGYLMQTIARNMAIGLGMTTSEGTIATNGVQPLATFVFAGLHYLAGGSKSGGIALVMIFSALFSGAAAYVFYRIAVIVLEKINNDRQFAMVIAALWFASPLIVPISMNGLETSLYHLCMLGACLYYLSVTASAQHQLSWRQRTMLGLLLGTAFLARNDAVFFIGVLLVVHLLVGGSTAAGGYARRFVDCVHAGIISVVIATPWLIYNYRLFGSIVPVSGKSEGRIATVAENLHFIPVKLLEVSFPYAPVPGRLEDSTVVMIGAIVFLVLCVTAFWYLVGKSSLQTRRFFLVTVATTLLMTGYYGVFFGVSYFFSRYLSALSASLWLMSALTIYCAVVLILKAQDTVRQVTRVLMTMFAAVAIAFGWASFARGTTHMHKQVVDWVSANVPVHAWVGAPQTGTLGYFHDRTINLDGKVNPEALRVLMREGHALNYVVDSKIDYVVDWVGMADWIKLTNLSPAFARQFEVVVRDPELNLAALKRINLKAP